MTPKTDLLADQLQLCRDMTLKTAAGVPESHRMTQLRDGKAHPLWLLGHLANTANVVMLQWALNGENITPPGFGKKFAPDFGGGDPITTGSGDYPSWEEVSDVYAKAMTTVVEKLRQLDDSALAQPLPGRIPEPLRARFKSVGDTLNMMVNHDSYHRGQIGLLAALHK